MFFIINCFYNKGTIPNFRYLLPLETKPMMNDSGSLSNIGKQRMQNWLDRNGLKNIKILFPQLAGSIALHIKEVHWSLLPLKKMKCLWIKHSLEVSPNNNNKKKKRSGYSNKQSICRRSLCRLINHLELEKRSEYSAYVCLFLALPIY